MTLGIISGIFVTTGTLYGIHWKSNRRNAKIKERASSDPWFRKMR
jgi:hypothetical protein